MKSNKNFLYVNENLRQRKLYPVNLDVLHILLYVRILISSYFDVFYEKIFAYLLYFSMSLPGEAVKAIILG